MRLDQGPFLLVQGDKASSLENISTLTLLTGGFKLIDGQTDKIDLFNRRIVLA